ncbi:unnamed protein product, partial [Callosobruchus maculatus]
MLAFPY